MKASRWKIIAITGMLGVAAACSGGSNPVGVQDDGGATPPPSAPMDTAGFVPPPGGFAN
jgi:hypothetical protein